MANGIFVLRTFAPQHMARPGLPEQGRGREDHSSRDSLAVLSLLQNPIETSECLWQKCVGFQVAWPQRCTTPFEGNKKQGQRQSRMLLSGASRAWRLTTQESVCAATLLQVMSGQINSCWHTERSRIQKMGPVKSIFICEHSNK